MEEQNPYQSPAEVSFVDPVLDPQSPQVAAESRRFVNFFVDSIVIRLLAVALGLVTGTDKAAQLLFYAFADFPFFPFFGPSLPIFILLLLFYYLLPEFFWGRTLSKFITGTKVVRADGATPTLFQIVGRTLCRMIPFDWFSFLETDPVGWHDRFSGTRVVMARST